MAKTRVKSQTSRAKLPVSDKNQETDIFRLSDQQSEALIKELSDCHVMSNGIIVISSWGLSLQFPCPFSCFVTVVARSTKFIFCRVPSSLNCCVK